MRSHVDWIGRVNRVLFAMLMAYAWTGAPTVKWGPGGAAALAQNPPQLTDGGAFDAPPTAEQLARTAAELGRWFDAVEEMTRQVPRDTFDPDAIVKVIGPEAAKLLAWVRDESSLVPYRGVLRGHQGVLMDRLGNSLDRALLLCALLRSAGHTVRLARGELDEAQARRVLQTVRPAPASFKYQWTSRRQMHEMAQQYAKKYPFDLAAVGEAIDSIALAEQALAESAAERTAAQAPLVTAALGERKINAPEPDALAALRDHWWVQRQEGERWIDLDPTLADAAQGQSLASATATFDPKSLSDLPEDVLHLLEIQVTVEFFDHNGPQELKVLNQKLLPAGLLGQKIVLRHIPAHWPAELDLFKEADPVARMKQTLLQESEWIPVLKVGQQNVMRYAFTDDGMMNDTTLPGYVQNVLAGRKLARAMEEGAESTGRDVGGILSGGGIGGRGARRKPADEAKPDPAPPKTMRLTAEWIDYTLHSPGQPPRKIRREIFDLIGPAARAGGKPPAVETTEARRLERALALAGEIEMLPQVCRISPQFVEELLGRSILANRGDFVDLFRPPGGKPPPPKEQLSHIGKLTPPPSTLYNLAQLRFEWSRFAKDIYLDRLNILTYRTRLAIDATGNLLARAGFDIVANEVAVHRGAIVNPWLIHLEQGVLDTNAEALLTGPKGRVENTAELFAAQPQADASPGAWITVRSTDDPAWKQVDLPADARARAEADLRSGMVVVIPAKPVNLQGRDLAGWWRIDPGSGDTLGIMQSGQGQTATEKVLTFIVTSLPSIYSFWASVYCGHVGKTTGLCNPCFILAMGFIGLITGVFFGAFAWQMGQRSMALFFGWDIALGFGGMMVGGMDCFAPGAKKYQKITPWPLNHLYGG